MQARLNAVILPSKPFADHACSVCKYAKYLWQGVCSATCPTGTRGVGTGNFNRVCVPTTRRDVALVSSANFGTTVGSSVNALAGVVSLLVVGAAVLGVLFARRRVVRPRITTITA